MIIMCSVKYIVAISCRFFLGFMPFLAVTDIDMLKPILVKDFDSFANRPVSHDVIHSFMHVHISNRVLLCSLSLTFPEKLQPPLVLWVHRERRGGQLDTPSPPRSLLPR